jgi:hypothetical protein
MNHRFVEKKHEREDVSSVKKKRGGQWITVCTKDKDVLAVCYS